MIRILIRPIIQKVQFAGNQSIAAGLNNFGPAADILLRIEHEDHSGIGFCFNSFCMT